MQCQSLITLSTITVKHITNHSVMIHPIWPGVYITWLGKAVVTKLQYNCTVQFSLCSTPTTSNHFQCVILPKTTWQLRTWPKSTSWETRIWPAFSCSNPLQGKMKSVQYHVQFIVVQVDIQLPHMSSMQLTGGQRSIKWPLPPKSPESCHPAVWKLHSTTAVNMIFSRYSYARNLYMDVNSVNCASVPASALIQRVLLKLYACAYAIYMCQLSTLGLDFFLVVAAWFTEMMLHRYFKLTLPT